jgi:glycerol-3-phosphate dehydrogenase
MAARRHDLVIVGGGITGAAIAWDAALRGLSVALVERDDFGHATTAASSKLVHGGLRYLKTWDWSLVHEALQERRIWRRIAPHLVRPLPFIIPAYGFGARGPLALGAGLVLYDGLARGTPSADPELHLPRARFLRAAAVLAEFPALESRGLTGGWRYFDAQMHCPERLALAFVRGAHDLGAAVANYAEVTDLLERSGAVEGVAVQDCITGERHEVRGNLVVNATGPWADRLVARRGAAAVRLVRSKGIHLIVPALHKSDALAMQTARRHFFVLPWRGHSLLATSDTPYDGDPAVVGTSEADIAELLSAVNRGLPGARLDRTHVKHFYAGLRPLVADRGVGAADTYGQSRKAAIVDHGKEEGVAGLLSVLGGKWTTSRHLAEQVVDLAARRLGKGGASLTATTPLPGGAIARIRDLRAALRTAHTAADPDVLDHWIDHYGSDAVALAVAALADKSAERVTPALPITVAEVRRAVRDEMAFALDDVVFRRTGLGTLGHPGEAALGRVADLVQPMLGWSAGQRSAELERVRRRFVVVDGPGSSGSP